VIEKDTMRRVLEKGVVFDVKKFDRIVDKWNF